jgi:SAM-dependent methyltransferase
LQKHPGWHAEDSQWKALQIGKILDKHNIAFSRYVEIGCGSGQILVELSKKYPHASFHGYDISSEAIKLGKPYETENIRLFNKDIFVENNQQYDIAAAIDVVEHTEDYIGFLNSMRSVANWFVFHIPLDICALNVLRNMLVRKWNVAGHLHFFMRETALAALSRTGYTVIEHQYILSDFIAAKSFKSKLMWLPRLLSWKLSAEVGARTLGGLSLLVLAQKAAPVKHEKSSLRTRCNE